MIHVVIEIGVVSEKLVVSTLFATLLRNHCVCWFIGKSVVIRYNIINC